MPSATGVRLLLKFNFGQQIRYCGWSEGYDLGYADLPTAIAAKAQIAAFIYSRVQCLGIGPLLVSAVLIPFVQPLHPGDPPARRNTIAFPTPAYPAAGHAYNSKFGATSKAIGFDSSIYDADWGQTVYYMSVQTALSGTPVYHRNMWIAGLPDVSDDTGSPRIVDAFTDQAVESFINSISNTGTNLASRNGVSIRSVDRSAGNPIKQCTAWNIGLNTYTVPGHGFVANQPIKAEGMKTIPGGSCPRGVYLVGTVVDANTITLQGSNAPTAPMKTGGYRANVFTFNQIQIVTGEGFTKRNKGRPSGLAVGRRRKPSVSRS